MGRTLLSALPNFVAGTRTGVSAPHGKRLTLAEGLGRVKLAASHCGASSIGAKLTTLLQEFDHAKVPPASILVRPKMRSLAKTWLVIFGAAILLSVRAGAAEAAFAAPPLDRGFQLLYNLEFDQAHNIFAEWEQSHPLDPMGPTAEAAGLLFSEFHRLGVLESQFFEDDKKFEDRPRLNPDPAVRAKFDAAIRRAQTAARVRLAKNSKDKDALFALTLTNGLQADYAALIEKRNMTSLRYTKESTQWAQQTLAVDPECYDAHIAGGISKYIVGSMAAPIRWLVRLGGVSGDKKEGVKELKIVAERGHYLAPFANILLAIAYVRDHDNERARELLAQLHDQFPDNPLFQREIARLDAVR